MDQGLLQTKAEFDFHPLRSIHQERESASGACPAYGVC